MDDPLRGDNYMYYLIFEQLLDEDLWNFCNTIIFCDASFTSIALFRDLWDKRGIGAVGPINSSKPSKVEAVIRGLIKSSRRVMSIT